MSALSELLTAANREDLSYDRIATLARKNGHQIGRDTVWKYMTGRHGAVSQPYLRAIASVLPVNIDAMESAAGVPRDLGPYRPPPEAAALDTDERDALDVLIKGIAAARGAQRRAEYDLAAFEMDKAGGNHPRDGERRRPPRKRTNTDEGPHSHQDPT